MELVTIQLDKERHLRLTIRGAMGYQTLTGQNLLSGFDPTKLTLRDITALLWACLIHEDKELKYEDVIDMIEIGDIPRVTKAVSQCIVQSFPDAKGDEVPLAGRAQSG